MVGKRQGSQGNKHLRHYAKAPPVGNRLVMSEKSSAKTIRLLPKEFHGFMDDRVVWARPNKQQDWWPCRCTKLEDLPKPIMNAFVKASGKKIVMYCFESNTFMLVPPQQNLVKEWEEGIKEKFDTKKMKGKKNMAQFPKAVEAAKKEFKEGKEESQESSSSSSINNATKKRKQTGDGVVPASKKRSIAKSDKEEKEGAVEDDIRCLVCGKGDKEELMLLCDGCETGATHTFCCKPPRSELPAESEAWFCEKCQKVSVHGMESGTDDENAVGNDESSSERESDDEDGMDEEEEDGEDYQSPQTQKRAQRGDNGKNKSEATIAPAETRVTRILTLIKSICTAHAKRDTVSARKSIGKLEKMRLSIGELRETKVGMELNRIGKDDSAPSISTAARELVVKWKEFAKSAAPVAAVQKPPSLPAPAPVSVSASTGAAGTAGPGAKGIQAAGPSLEKCKGSITMPPAISIAPKSELPARPMASPLAAAGAGLKVGALKDLESQKATSAAGGGSAGAMRGLLPSNPPIPRAAVVPPSLTNWEPKSRVASFSLKALVSGVGGKSADKTPSGQSTLGGGGAGALQGNGRAFGNSSGNSGSGLKSVRGGMPGEALSAGNASTAARVGAVGGTEADLWNPAAVPPDCKSTVREVSAHLLHNALQHTQASILVEKAVFDSFGRHYDRYLTTINGLSFNLLEPSLSGLVRRIVVSTADPMGASGPQSLDLKLVVSNVDNLFQLGIA